MKRSVELLAPAGNMECFEAAVNAGADAVYLGGDKFNARAYASNFSVQELIRALDMAHIYGRRVYLTLNILFKDAELSEIPDYIQPLYRAGLDGVILQDLGAAALIRQCFPGLPLHASTQMSVTDTEGMLYLKKQGFKRVVPARELSLKELKVIREKTGMELECFIHGALCYSYSGKCLFSSLLGGRSGNRGRCAGPCRLPYNGRYYLSAKDICTASILDRLIEAGISSFKIEGRMKGPEYVAGVTGIYRGIIDRYYRGEPLFADNAGKKELVSLYTRGGNSEGYYFQKNGPDMISLENPSYESADEELKKRLYLEYAQKKPQLPLHARITVKEGEEAVLKLSYIRKDQEISVTVTGDRAQSAKNRALSREDVIKQIKKSGNTEFVIDEPEIIIEGRPFITVASLNALRRSAIEALRGQLLSGYHRETEAEPAGGKESLLFEKPESNKANESRILHVCVSDAGQLESVLSTKVQAVSVMLSTADGREGLVRTAERIREAGKLFYPRMPYIIRRGFCKRESELLRLMCEKSDGVMIDNLESLSFLLDIGYDKLIIADIHLYAMNGLSHSVLRAGNANLITTVPVELNKKELFKRGLQGEELIVYGRLPMMESAQCVKRTMRGCSREREIIRLKDRYSNEFPCINFCEACTNVIYNSVPLCITEKDGVVERLAPGYMRLDFTDEEPGRIVDIINYYVNYGSNVSDPPVKDYTKGHLNRGVE